jgi:hypothetical protein
MSNTRYGHDGPRGSQDKAERKDEGWQSRQGGSQSRPSGQQSEPTVAQPGEPGDVIQLPPPGTNTQGELAGIGEAAEESARRLELEREPDEANESDEAARAGRVRDARGAGTDQPPRMGGPLGSDPRNPHLPEGAQDGQSRGTGAGGFDRGVDASNIGAVHQGAKPEDR